MKSTMTIIESPATLPRTVKASELVRGWPLERITRYRERLLLGCEGVEKRCARGILALHTPGLCHPQCWQLADTRLTAEGLAVLGAFWGLNGDQLESLAQAWDDAELDSASRQFAADYLESIGL